MGIDMAIKMIDASEMNIAKGKHVVKGERVVKAEYVTNGKSVAKIEHITKEKEETKEYKRPEIVVPVACVTKKTMTILSEGKIIRCERRESGTTSNCAICEGITKEIFDRCKHKWTEY
jgi:hypothetical protein